MRPEHRCSGKHGVQPQGLIRSSRFNEAGASLLRKTRVLCYPGIRMYRFNEAGASLLRKTAGGPNLTSFTYTLQ